MRHPDAAHRAHGPARFKIDALSQRPKPTPQANAHTGSHPREPTTALTAAPAGDTGKENKNDAPSQDDPLCGR